MVTKLITLQPTGGVILLHDTTPENAKTLLELKVKKAGTQPAPVRDNANGSSATSGLDILSGAAAAAGVLTAVDEDDDDGEEAEVPDDFDYHSDGDSD